MLNVVEFLDKGHWAPANVNEKKEARLTITKQHTKLNAKSTTYHFVDNTSKFTKADWNRVVGIILQGPAWQLKGMPWPTPPDIFNNIRGIYFRFEDELDNPVKAWDVKILTISKVKRHLDSPAVLAFWTEMERVILTMKPQLNVL
eukprot:gnl/Hemi2/13455_TR4603_c1_g2_i1.p1 gnl/Hemi2/13455_TR4603_c1_g2~~gnl/Hemi2/13455_TR4603_c1_g2_i1.p1  ORF type:complete len:145 (-),score=48.13 gnl/Hemi2/13455_TR4603_c1_g2_i1:240-674(-)